MAFLRIRNFGPIKDGFSQKDGFMEITPITIFCGNQSTGKSTVAKLYSSFVWLEKKAASQEVSRFTSKTFFKQLLNYHKIDSYLKNESEIEFIGDAYKFFYSENKFKAEKLSNTTYVRPKVEYVPSERNFCTSIQNASYLKGLSKNTFDFLSDFMIASTSLNNSKYKLPLNGFEYRYDSKKNASFISDSQKNYEIDVVSASSGLQSLSPMALTTSYYSKLLSTTITENQDFSFEQKKRWEALLQKGSYVTLNDAITKFRDKSKMINLEDTVDKTVFNNLIQVVNSRFVNIVEEPEQNLYPDSQAEVLFYLLQCFNNQFYNISEKIQNNLLITTHSPYVISYLTISAKAAELIGKNVPKDKIQSIIPVEAAVEGRYISLFETKSNGTIELLNPIEDLPSDENELNKALEKQNELFSELLDLEVQFCK